MSFDVETAKKMAKFSGLKFSVARTLLISESNRSQVKCDTKTLEFFWCDQDFRCKLSSEFTTVAPDMPQEAYTAYVV